MCNMPCSHCSRVFVLGSGLLAASLVLAAVTQAADIRPIGWAAAEDGTLGGTGGVELEAADAETLSTVLRRPEPKTIRVSGTIRLDESVRMTSDTTLVGVGSDAKLIGGGLHLRKVRNVIVRNLTIAEASDAINIEESQYVWIDHCDLSNCRDGLIDIKRGSDFITVSWNHFHNHHKTCLLGHSDKPEIRQLDTGHLRVTYHHNYFDGTDSRHPRVRFGDPVHVFNNYFRGNSYGVASVMDAGVFVEANYFEDVKQPTLTAYGDSPDPGRLVERENVFVRSGQPQSAGKVDESRLGYFYKLDSAEQLPDLLRRETGVGRIAELAP